MPTANQYALTHKELTELIIKQAGVHEGKWILMLSFGFTAGNFGPTEDDVLPGGVAIVQSVGIQRVEVDSPSGLIVDAAKVNPASS